MADTLFVLEFQEACAAEGCPFCRISRTRSRRYLSTLLYEYATAPDIHLRLADSRGFCRAHSSLAKRIARAEGNDGLAVAILYATVVQRIRADLESALGDGVAAVRPLRYAEAVRAAGNCPVCVHQQESEQYTLGVFVDDVSRHRTESELARAYETSDGACRPHFEALMGRCTVAHAALWLAQRFCARLDELSGQLETYMRRHQVEHRADPMGAERDSWVRAMEMCAGRNDLIPVQERGGVHS